MEKVRLFLINTVDWAYIAILVLRSSWGGALLLVKLILLIRNRSDTWSTGYGSRGKLTFIKVEICIIRECDIVDDLLSAWIVASELLITDKWSPATATVCLTKSHMTALISDSQRPVSCHTCGRSHIPPTTLWRIGRLRRMVECLVMIRGHLRGSLLLTLKSRVDVVFPIEIDALRAIFVFHVHHGCVLSRSCFCNTDLIVTLRLCL